MDKQNQWITKPQQCFLFFYFNNWQGKLIQAKCLLQLLLGAKVVGVSTFLLATVNSTRVQAGITPVKEVDSAKEMFLGTKEYYIYNQRWNTSAQMHLKYSEHLSGIPSPDAIYVHALTRQRLRTVVWILTCGRSSCRSCTFGPAFWVTAQWYHHADAGPDAEWTLSERHVR